MQNYKEAVNRPGLVIYTIFQPFFIQLSELKEGDERFKPDSPFDSFLH